ncbi:aldose 1-epimerase [Bogoriella caseilytica]|uniref:Aldose 1-epimerase n=1 Tax=Bogoriella caseilytica TaxID=56055 RepID=A0A3N2BFL9_9MICO|nr:aldose 1-epimerase [Bogoriella caseilytica]ROR74061.1 aldose 1-epimerase [Bogoriella caseilytica]
MNTATTWTLTHPSGARLDVAATGATALSWHVPGADGALVDLLDGYRDAEELAAEDGYRCAVLAPWSNRLRDARWRYEGDILDVAPGVDEEREDASLHGLVTDQSFQPAGGDITPGETAHELTLATTIAARPAYPFELELRVHYALAEGPDGQQSLSIEIIALNTGDRHAPVGLGWHPYVRLPGHATIDELHLEVPAASVVTVDDKLIPLADPLESTGGKLSLTPVAGAEIDLAFAGLHADDEGMVKTTLSSPRTGDRLSLWQRAEETDIVHLFTGDFLERDRRASAAIEPCTFGADALNRELDAMLIAPGHSRRLRAEWVFERGH